MNKYSQIAMFAMLAVCIIFSGIAAIKPLEVTTEMVNISVESANLSSLDRLYEITDDYTGFELADNQADVLKDALVKTEDDFIEAFSELVGIDEDYLVIKTISYKDQNAFVFSVKDKDDENFEVSVFMKIKYKDEDESDYSYAYVLAEATLDEGDLDNYSLTEVARTFEFE